MSISQHTIEKTRSTGKGRTTRRKWQEIRWASDYWSSRHCMHAAEQVVRLQRRSGSGDAEAKIALTTHQQALSFSTNVQHTIQHPIIASAGIHYTVAAGRLCYIYLPHHNSTVLTFFTFETSQAKLHTPSPSTAPLSEAAQQNHVIYLHQSISVSPSVITVSPVSVATLILSHTRPVKGVRPSQPAKAPSGCVAYPIIAHIKLPV